MMFTIENVTDPVWANEAHTMIKATVKFDELDKAHPFGATKDNKDDYNREVFERCAAGEFGPIGDYVPPPVVDPEPTINDIDGKIKSVHDRVTDIDGHIQSIDAQISSVDSHTANLDNRITALAARVAALETP